MPIKKAKPPLSKTHPKLAKEADGWDPSKVTHGSDKNLLWRCAKGHSWSAKVSKRSVGKKSCPSCKPNLSTTHPEIAAEAHQWDPSTVTFGSGHKKSWKCKKGHIWNAAPNSRTAGRGCPYCSNLLATPGVNDLATTHPEIAAEAHGWDPSKVIAGSERTVDWICKKNHVYKMVISNRIKSLGCVYCSNWKTLPGFNDLLTTHPEIAEEAHGWDPSSVTQGSGLIKEWKCQLGHVWKARVEARVSGRGCIYCSNWSVLPGFNDLKTTHPEIAKQAHGWDPSKVIAGSNKKFEWQCDLGHVSSSNITNRKRGNGCPVCSGYEVLIGFNDLATQYPDIASTAFNWDPTTVTSGSKRKVKWKCPLGHVWVSEVRNRAKKNQGCSICAGRTVLIGFNDLKTLNPEVAKQAVGWDPTSVVAKSEAKKLWRCAKGHEWTAMVSSRNRGQGCPTCAPFGFDPNENGYIYLIEQNNWLMLQVGITNSPEIRLKTHSYSGWDLIDIRGPMDGHLTQQWETAILRMLKAKGSDLSNEKIAGKFDGYSEAWSKSTFPVKSIKDLMQMTEEFEEEKSVTNLSHRKTKKD